MAYEDQWQSIQEKAAQVLAEARYLHDAGMYQGACLLAAASCLQSANAAVRRLRQERDPPALFDAIRLMAKDGRLPPVMAKAMGDILSIHADELSTAPPRGAKNSQDTIALAETVGRLFTSAASLTESRRSPELRKRAAEKGISIPMGW